MASKTAINALAVVTVYEANAFGIETVIVTPGAITEGTERFPTASSASDTHEAAAYSALAAMVADTGPTGVMTTPPSWRAGTQSDGPARWTDLPRASKP
ncbi:hypothetical protein [Virgisporangium aliadipatigenens]|uniref:hypothetical protein n=1 Tax=Virgisporangium aliadipatigenens TaxID=741659 RepID=UPI00194522C4|nr:hypothetical protein [Virgisporangium aliadipatigenens]